MAILRRPRRSLQRLHLLRPRLHGQPSLSSFASKVLLDSGSVQADALTVDRLASLEKYSQIAVETRDSILATEVEWLKSIKANIVVSDVIPVACRAAADAGIRFVCVTNFSRDFIYAEYVMAAGNHHRSIVWQVLKLGVSYWVLPLLWLLLQYSLGYKKSASCLEYDSSIETSELSAKVNLPHVAFNDLQIGGSSQSIVARLLHFWEARNPKKGGQLMGVEMLLIDKESTVMECFIGRNHISNCVDDLRDGMVYLITTFEVDKNKTQFKLADHQFMIRFTEKTEVIEVGELVCQIEKEKFRLRDFAEILVLANRNEELLDVIGKLCLVEGSNLKDATSFERIVEI